MQRLTYRQAYDKIIEAYFKDEIKPLNSSFCFCGTLNKNDNFYWLCYDRKIDGIYYSGNELQRLEVAFLIPIAKNLAGVDLFYGDPKAAYSHPNYENALFAGMSAALEVLKQIHKDRGESVDEDIPVFTQRKLETVNN